ncbi:NRDE family protein [Hyunsoonleella aestuarii]|uniref:NRDE family protein n=1 Tax=Hyunsoonleella aestuarii TaxID=912802 RepID=A0ABP8E7K3_9FLAO|nr:NRDE family protein [Hyunsoonleella aestuarii]
MCTVTLIPQGKNNFILTSNRDEAPDRASLSPDFYVIAETKLLFPKDKMGGTWIGIGEKNRVVCVLNGAFEKHKRQSNYRKSRGIVANDFMVADNIVETVDSYNFMGIEPFTIVIADWNTKLSFYELVWDGSKKHFRELPLVPRIWSSSTLYSKTMQIEREQWFKNFMVSNELNSQSILNFHSTEDVSNMNFGVIMNRGFVKTTSITQVEKQGREVEMRYENLQTKKVTSKTFNLSEVVNG